jgi:hypothetical protein
LKESEPARDLVLILQIFSLLNMVAFRVACLAHLVVFASATRGAPTQLKGAQAVADLKVQTLMRSKVMTALGGFALHTAPGAAETAAAAGKAPSAGGKAPSGTDQPVAVQVEESVLDQLHKDLSPSCSKRFSAMLKGEGPQMHQFNEHGETTGQCDKLEGKICNQEVAITESYTAPQDGRKLEQRLEVTGNSCLPKECMVEKDLDTLANFMHKQTKEMMPGMDTFIELNVDCSKSGGGSVMVGQAGPKPEQPKQKSAAFAFAFGPVAAILCAMAF